MQLLALGRSLGRIGDRQNRYKLTQQSLLPKFGTVKGPDGSVRDGEPLDLKTRELNGEDAVVVSQTRRRNKDDRTTIMKSTVQSEPMAASATGRIPQAFPHGRWTLFKNPFTNTSKLKPTPGPRQSELLLDSVKPVRNDLTDSDLEVVAAGHPPAERRATPEAVSAPNEKPETSSLVWGRIRTQLFGADKV
jgi:hypothetical protein